jgi:hypothetical protein
MCKGRWVELFVDEITNVTDDNQDEVADELVVYANDGCLAYLMYVVTKTKYAGLASPSG